MGEVKRMFNVGDEVPPVVKTMTQDMINLFEKSGRKTEPSQFTDVETAQKTLGTKGTAASGRMTARSLLDGLKTIRSRSVLGARAPRRASGDEGLTRWNTCAAKVVGPQRGC